MGLTFQSVVYILIFDVYVTFTRVYYVYCVGKGGGVAKFCC